MNLKQTTIVQLFNAAARTTTTTGSAVDLAGYTNPGGRNIKAYLDVSTALGTSASYTVKIQEGDNTTTFTDITGATFTAVTTSNTGESIHFVTAKRYIRAIQTFTSNTTSVTSSGCILVENRIT